MYRLILAQLLVALNAVQVSTLNMPTWAHTVIATVTTVLAVLVPAPTQGARQGGDVTHGRALEPPPGEQVQGGGNHPVTGIGSLGHKGILGD